MNILPPRTTLRGSFVLAILTLVCASDLGHASTVSLTPVADSTLQQAFPNNNFGDGTSFTAGGRRQGGLTRGLVRFDVAGNLPANAVVTSVSLAVSVVGVPSGGANSTFELHRVLASWGEGTGSDHGGSVAGANQVTWNNRFGSSGSPWTTPGGDFSATASATRAIAGFGAYSFSSTANLVADVQAWYDTPANNFGWLLLSQSEATGTTIRRFGSRDDAANRPVLTIQYSIVPEPGTLSLLVMGLMTGVLFARRRRR